MVELGVIPLLSPLRMITVLLAPARIAPSGLEVSPGVHTNPDITIGGWYGQSADPCELGREAYTPPVRFEVDETLSMLEAADAGLVVAAEAQTVANTGTLCP
jgi:hypothetical protein